MFKTQVLIPHVVYLWSCLGGVCGALSGRCVWSSVWAVCVCGRVDLWAVCVCGRVELCLGGVCVDLCLGGVCVDVWSSVWAVCVCVDVWSSVWAVCVDVLNPPLNKCSTSLF
jgi:hypothetical protein